MRSRSDVFAALADPRRRFIVEALAERGDATATELASQLPVTRQAVTKHLGTLADAGLIAGARAGRETRYRLTPGPLADAAEWMTRVGSDWDDRLAALARAVGNRGGPTNP